MSTGAQVVSILRKDLSAHLLDIGLLLLLNLAFVALVTESWPETVAADGFSTGGFAALVVEIAIFVIWALLIVQVIQADTATGHAAYWLTRPFSRLALPGAKAAFVLLAIHLPSFVAQLAILVFSGVPLSVGQLLVNQGVFLVCWSLPIMLFASLTQSLTHFVLAVVAFGVLVLTMPVVIVGRVDVLEVFGDLLDPIPVEIVLRMIVLAVLAVGALIWQYRTRRTLTVAASCAGAVFLLFLVTAATPQNFEHWGRSLLEGAPAARPDIRFRPTAERPLRDRGLPAQLLGLVLPLEMSGTEGIEFRRRLVHIRTLTGPEQQFTTFGWIWPAGGAFWIDLAVPRQFYETEVSVSIDVGFEHYESHDSDAIPIDGRPGIVDGRLQCGFAADRGGTSGFVLCRSSVHLESSYVARSRVAVITESSLPFRFALNPIMIERIVALPVPGGDSATPLATVIRVPTGYARQVVEINPVRLQDWVRE